MKYKIAGRVLVAAALILSGCGKAPAEPAGQNQAQDQEQQQVQEEKGGAIKSTLNDLMNLGKSTKCVWKLTDEGAVGEGTVYVSGKNMRQDVKYAQEDGDIEMHVISDGVWMYQWNSQTKEGTKMNIEEMAKLGDGQPEEPELQAGQGAVKNFQQEYEFDCDNWNEDASVFEVPSDVNFVDTTEMIKQMSENAEQMQTQMCQMCESLPAEAKAECLKACQQ